MTHIHTCMHTFLHTFSLSTHIPPTQPPPQQDIHTHTHTHTHILTLFLTESLSFPHTIFSPPPPPPPAQNTHTYTSTYTQRCTHTYTQRCTHTHTHKHAHTHTHTQTTKNSRNPSHLQTGVAEDARTGLVRQQLAVHQLLQADGTSLPLVHQPRSPTPHISPSLPPSHFLSTWPHLRGGEVWGGGDVVHLHVHWWGGLREHGLCGVISMEVQVCGKRPWVFGGRRGGGRGDVGGRGGHKIIPVVPLPHPRPNQHGVCHRGLWLVKIILRHKLGLAAAIVHFCADLQIIHPDARLWLADDTIGKRRPWPCTLPTSVQHGVDFVHAEERGWWEFFQQVHLTAGNIDGQRSRNICRGPNRGWGWRNWGWNAVSAGKVVVIGGGILLQGYLWWWQHLKGVDGASGVVDVAQHDVVLLCTHTRTYRLLSHTCRVIC